jgi:hypothetical protein
MGGALGRPAKVPDAVPGRSGAFSLLVLGPAAPELARVVPAIGRGVLTAMADWKADESMINFLGEVSGPGEVLAAYPPASRERLIHRVGGLLPVWRGGVGIDQHVASAKAVIANGAVFAQMPEGTVSGPPGRIGPFRAGWAVIALRTDPTIVPLAIAGTEELYLGRRLASRILPPTTVRALAGLPEGAALPAEGSREELAMAGRMSDALSAMLGPAVEALYPWTVDPPEHPRRFRKRLTWLLLRPGRLDRDA